MSVVLHDVPRPCGESDASCHRFEMGDPMQTRYVLLRFHGIYDSHYIGINRLRMFAGPDDLPYRVLSADGIALASGTESGAGCVAVDGGWWAPCGDGHSLLVELDEDDALTSIGLWCANAGATPRMVEICDARAEEPAFCAECEREELRRNRGVRDVKCAASPPIVCNVPSGCGKGDNECQVFAVDSSECVSHLLLRFKGIQNSHYIGINRLRLYKKDGVASLELPYTVLAADGTAQGAKDCCVGVNGGWWATCGDDHSLLLKLEPSACIDSIGLWCANAGATPCEMHVITDLSWIQSLIEVLGEVAKDPCLSLGRNARRLITNNSSLLVGLAANDCSVRDAVLAPVFSGGQSLNFPLRKEDALGRLQAQMLCDMSVGLHAELPGCFRGHRINGDDWQEFSCNELPVLESCSVSLESKLLYPATSHGDEWLGTGLYVPPGGSVRITPGGCLGAGWRARVGAHTDDISCHDVWPRWPRVSLDVALESGKTTCIFTPFGGLLYLVRACGASNSVEVRVEGNLVQQPRVSVLGGIDTAAISESHGGWIDCEGRNVILTVPVRSVKEALAAGANVIAALEFYDKLWSHYNDLSPWTDPRPQRIVPDVEISLGWMHSGYPIMTHYGEVLETSASHPIPRVFDVQRVKNEGNWGLFHEMGHNMQRASWTFDGTVEVTVNIFTLYGLKKLCDEGFTQQKFKEHTVLPEEFYRVGCPRGTWDSDPFLALRTYAQVISTFGWEPLMNTFKEYADEGEVARDYPQQIQDFVRRWSLAIGRDIRPHWRKWGFQKEVDGHDTDLAALEPWSYA